MILKRNDYRQDGIFGDMQNDDGSHFCVTLEHAYTDLNGNPTPKVAEGVYNCIRHAPNRLPYETFMLENVPDFQGQSVSGILIHIGNFNADSIGCCLLGAAIVLPSSGEQMITDSKTTFSSFMNLQSNINSFTLTIVGK